MEDEKILTGYCRCADRSRMVTVELLDGRMAAVDCGYGNCPYEPGCQIAVKIKELDK